MDHKETSAEKQPIMILDAMAHAWIRQCMIHSYCRPGTLVGPLQKWKHIMVTPTLKHPFRRQCSLGHCSVRWLLQLHCYTSPLRYWCYYQISQRTIDENCHLTPLCRLIVFALWRINVEWTTIVLLMSRTGGNGLSNWIKGMLEL